MVRANTQSFLIIKFFNYYTFQKKNCVFLKKKFGFKKVLETKFIQILLICLNHDDDDGI